MGKTMNAAVRATTTPNGTGRHLTLVRHDHSGLDAFLVSIGAKQMANEKPTSPLEWNGKVVGLTVGLLTVMTALVLTVFWAATLAADVRQLQSEGTRTQSEREKLQLSRDNQLRQIDERIRLLEVQAAAQRVK